MNDAYLDQNIPYRSWVINISKPRTDSHSNYSAHMWAVQYCLDYKHMLYRQCLEVYRVDYILEQPVSARVVQILVVGRQGQSCGRWAVFDFFLQSFAPV